MSAAAHRYDGVTVLLHWVLALALIAQAMLGWWMVDLPKTPPGLRAGWFNLHKSVGLLVLAAVLLRSAWRLTHPAPPYTDPLPTWQARMVRLSHALLYAGMWLLPVSGLLGSAASAYRSARPTQTYSLLSKSAADFLLHRGWFHSGLTTRARAFLSTG